MNPRAIGVLMLRYLSILSFFSFLFSRSANAEIFTGRRLDSLASQNSDSSFTLGMAITSFGGVEVGSSIVLIRDGQAYLLTWPIVERFAFSMRLRDGDKIFGVETAIDLEEVQEDLSPVLINSDEKLNELIMPFEEMQVLNPLLKNETNSIAINRDAPVRATLSKRLTRDNSVNIEEENLRKGTDDRSPSSFVLIIAAVIGVIALFVISRTMRCVLHRKKR